MKKLNAVLGWFALLAMLGHLMTMTYSLMTGWYDFTICKTLAYATAITVGAHVLVSLIIMFFFHDGSTLGSYSSLNRRTIVQRASALIVLVLLHAHVKSFGFIVEGAPLDMPTAAFIVITEVLFFGAIFTHLSVSFSKSLISMGLLRSETAEKRINTGAMVVCVLGFVITCYAVVQFIVAWMSR